MDIMISVQKKQWERFMDSWKKMGAPGRPNRRVCLILFKHIKDYKYWEMCLTYVLTKK